MEAWRLITTWEAEPGFNMALDEGLLERGPEVPTLRFYTWRPDALSLGYFQRERDVPLERLDDTTVVVRRLTGGGAIHHRDELTFSITAPLAHPLYRGPVAASYERVHGAIAATLAELGVAADLRGDAELASDRAGTGMCFHHSTSLDLVWSGAKGVGSAQRRKGGRVLHHGSIKLGTTPLEGSIATLHAARPGLTPDELAEHLLVGFGSAFGARFEAASPRAEEAAWARDRADHFQSPSFVGRR